MGIVDLTNLKRLDHSRIESCRWNTLPGMKSASASPLGHSFNLVVPKKKLDVRNPKGQPSSSQPKVWALCSAVAAFEKTHCQQRHEAQAWTGITANRLEGLRGI